MTGNALPAALETWLAGQVPGYLGPGAWHAFSGGRSNPTYRIASGSGDYVLRRQPPGVLQPSAHALDREYQVLRALEGSACPAPRPIALCEDREIVGTMFYVMEYIPGRLFWSGLLPDAPPRQRRAIHFALIDALAALHATEWQTTLPHFARSGSYTERQLVRWRQQLTAIDHVPGELLLLADQLARSRPVSERACLIHGDYRIDNVLIHPDRGRVAAVIDWELATIGDPLSDFSYYLTAWLVPPEHGGMAGADLEAMGIPSLDEIVALYTETTGFDILPTLDWYLSFNLWRLAAICLGIIERVRAGSMAKERAIGIADRIPVLTDRAQIHAGRARI